jgi:hypothetical protein
MESRHHCWLIVEVKKEEDYISKTKRKTMIISESFIYLELHKTGCTYTRDIPLQVKALNPIAVGKHNVIEELPGEKKHETPSKIIFGNIRNPWDWYVSLWAFGCMKKGGLYKKFPDNIDYSSLTGWKEMLRRIRDNELINTQKEKLYAKAADPEEFKTWLKIVLNRKASLGEGYKQSEISKEVGLMTYRYLKMYTKNGVKAVQKFKTLQDAKDHDFTNTLLKFTIRNENINEDLLKHALDIHVDQSELLKILDESKKRTNSSKRKKYTHYYDEESIELVRKKEKLIIDKYNYTYD